MDDGLIVRPKALTKTMVVAYQVEHKYKEIQKRAASYKALESSSKVGRPKKDWQYCNRVGRKDMQGNMLLLQYTVLCLKYFRS